MGKPNTPRTPIKDVVRWPNLRGQMEIWEAVSADDVWTYQRLEIPGTPWEVTHVPTGRSYWVGSLPKARAATASGHALAYLDRTQPVAKA
jgi:hypothetical protein